MLVRCIVIDNQMQSHIRRCHLVQMLEKPQKLVIAVPRQALAYDLAARHIQRRKQGGCPMALVVMGERLCLDPLEWQAGLGSIQRLYLTLLVHAQHDGFFRRVEIEPNNIHQLVAKV